MKIIKLSKKRLMIFLIIISNIFFLANITFAQLGRLSGSVTDDVGNPLPNVKITIFDPYRNIRITTRTDNKGKFSEMGLIPSTYEIIFEMKGYPSIKKIVKLHIGELKLLNIKMIKFNDGLIFLKNGDYKAAIEFFRKLEQNSPDNFSASYYLGISYLMYGDIDNAIIKLKRAKELRSDIVSVNLYLGECYIQKGLMSKALEAFSKAIDLRPNNAELYEIIGFIYEKYEKIDESIMAFRKAEKIDPLLPSIHYQLGRAYLKKGKRDKSLIHFERFLELEPNDPKASKVKIVVEELKKLINKDKK